MIDLKKAFERHVNHSRGVLRVCDDLYQLDSYSRVMVIAFGRHADTMASLLKEQLGLLASGIISAPQEENAQLPGFRYFHGGEPLPTAESFRAADAILKSLGSLDARSLAIFLISAGSSFVESPADREISVDDMAQTYNMLGGSEAPPEAARTILKHLSAVKGGHLALAAAKQGARQLSLVLPESPTDRPSLIACGPTMPDPTSVEDCYRIASQYRLADRFPASVRELFERRALEETPDKDHPAFHNCRWWPIIDSKEHP